MSFFLMELLKLPPPHTGGKMLTRLYILTEISEMTHISIHYLKGLIDNGRLKETKTPKCV